MPDTRTAIDCDSMAVETFAPPIVTTIDAAISSNACVVTVFSSRIGRAPQRVTHNILNIRAARMARRGPAPYIAARPLRDSEAVQTSTGMAGPWSIA